MALEGLAKWSAFLLASCACAIGCSTATRGPVAPTRAHWLPGYVLGIWGTADLDVRDDCPTTGAASVRVGGTWATLAVTVLTLGIYTPREVRVQCRAQP